MVYFNNDYSEGCVPEILEALAKYNMEQTPGYGVDLHCIRAADKIKKACKKEDASVYFLVGGTQTNLTVIAAVLRPYQAVIAAQTGHISVHETGAIEATGHKVIELPGVDGKITAKQIEENVLLQSDCMDSEHMVQPKLVYISSPTEFGTLYSLEELWEIRKVCDTYGLYLFIDGARMGYGLTAEGNDVFLPDFAEIAHVFYVGGTKVGALFGEAIVITDNKIATDFRYMIKQRGGMLAKGRLLGIQFEALFEDDLYSRIALKANRLAQVIRSKLCELGYGFLVHNTTNQLFPIFPNSVLNELEKDFCFSDMGAVDNDHRAVRICTSWATTEENVRFLCEKLNYISDNHN